MLDVEPEERSATRYEQADAGFYNNRTRLQEETNFITMIYLISSSVGCLFDQAIFI